MNGRKTRPAWKGKGKGNREERVSKRRHTAEHEDLGTAGNGCRTRWRRKKMRRTSGSEVAPNMGAGGSHPQAMADPGEEDGDEGRDEKKVSDEG